ncbi:MAG: class I SAM-dependent methyltransferase [Acidobacteria bacterium]|nr:class I SAM-dependent methyltransferase [Acidobacteriota bacterium]
MRVARSFALLLPVAIGLGQTPGRKNLAPFVTTPQNVVEKMLEMARIKPGETVFDLGCGDGRVLVTAVQKFEARAVGVEISERLVKSVNETLQKENIAGRARVVHGDLMDVDLGEADVVTLYLMRDANDTIRPKLERDLKPGARVVSHDYEIRGWKPVAVEYAEAHRRKHAIYMYEIPRR